MKTKLAVAIASVCALFLAFLHTNRGVDVTVKNVGASPLRSVVIQVIGGSYSIGALNPGQSKQAKVTAIGESHIELQHASAQRLVINCYFEGGYRGSISIEVSASRVVSHHCDVRAGLL